MTDRMKVPFLDLIGLHLELEPELSIVFQTALRSAGFIGGPMVEKFEQEFARFCGTDQCVGVGSGTDALRFAIIAGGVEPGDIVITVPNTFIATTEAISQAGAVPEFVDVDQRTYNMDPTKLAEYLETKCAFDPARSQLVHCQSGRAVRAVIPVHLYGQTADMDPILELANKYNIMVIEDACQAHGAKYYSQKDNCWKAAGSMGKAAAFSFYPGKNLGACGEAGAVTTNDDVLARKVRVLRDHGQAEKYYHDVEGYNGRLDAIQAGFLSVKLRHLENWNESRRARAQSYTHQLAPLPACVVLPYEPSWSRSVYHLYVVQVPDRELLREHLAKSNIGTGIHYPIPLHLQRAYQNRAWSRGSFPVAEKVAGQILSLPMYPHLGADQQKCVVDEIAKFVALREPVREEVRLSA